MAQYIPAYPPLQPHRVMTMQPPMTREDMVYPGASQTNKYDDAADNIRNAGGIGIQGQPHLINTPLGSDTIPGPYGTEVSSPSFGRHSAFIGLSQRYSQAQGFEVKDDPEGLDIQGRSATFDLFSHQRTLPARRGPFKDHDQRERTARTRKMGSCIRCRMQRIRVSHLLRGLLPVQCKVYIRQ